MSKKQLRRYEVLCKANAGFISAKEAGEALGISVRQVKRLKKKVRELGAVGVVHKNSMRSPKNAIALEVKDKILELRRKTEYQNSNFKHFRELLSEVHEIEISYSSLYTLLTSNGIKSPKTRRRFKPHRRRKRRPQAGLLVQTDATPFAWFVSSGDKKRYALHGAIDDATGQITGLYMCKNECLNGYFELFKRTIRSFGIPVSVYADRHTIFQSPNAGKAQIDASIPVNDTQLGKALKQLNISLIGARSPQAKGRIERLWETLQSRLPVEFAVHGINTIEKANKFLSEYIYAFNSQFAVEPENTESMFTKPEDGLKLDYVLCVKEQRVVDSGGVFSYKGRSYKVSETPNGLLIPPNSRASILVSPVFGIKAQYRNVVFDVFAYLPPKQAKKKRPEPKPRIYRPVSDDHYYKSGELPGIRHVFGESDSEILQMLHEVCGGTIHSKGGDIFPR